METKEQTIEKENLKSFTLRDYIFRVDAKPNLRENENHAKMLRDKILEQTKGKISKVPRNRRLDVRKNILLMVNPKSGPGNWKRLFFGVTFYRVTLNSKTFSVNLLPCRKIFKDSEGHRCAGADSRRPILRPHHHEAAEPRQGPDCQRRPEALVRHPHPVRGRTPLRSLPGTYDEGRLGPG